MTNLAALELVARALGPMRGEVVFVGGSVRGLLITDPAAPPERHTDDVDVIVVIPRRVPLATPQHCGYTIRDPRRTSGRRSYASKTLS